MFKSLMADMIAIDVDPLGTIDLARRHGFTGVDLRLARHEQRIRQIGSEKLRKALADANLRPGYCSILPGKISCDEDTWRQGVARTPALAELAEQLGYTRTSTVVLPFDDEYPFDEFFALHVDRLNEVAPMLADHGLSLGLEYVSPLTRRAGHKHPFIHDLKGLRKLCRATQHTNIGIMLDSFHWHCAGESVDDIEALSEDEVVVVHVNDLIAKRAVDRQVVTERALPCETGVIDLAAFMGALDRIGYDGPITAEPTNPKWAETDAERAAAMLSESMDQLMALVAA